MVAFSNGCESEKLDNQCCDCINSKDDGQCPVSLIQFLFNYDQLKAGNEQLQEVMTLLIDENGICKMKESIDKYFKERTT
jgi:hypothetical protein